MLERLEELRNRVFGALTSLPETQQRRLLRDLEEKVGAAPIQAENALVAAILGQSRAPGLPRLQDVFCRSDTCFVAIQTLKRDNLSALGGGSGGGGQDIHFDKGTASANTRDANWGKMIGGTLGSIRYRLASQMEPTNEKEVRLHLFSSTNDMMQPDSMLIRVKNLRPDDFGRRSSIDIGIKLDVHRAPALAEIIRKDPKQVSQVLEILGLSHLATLSPDLNSTLFVNTPGQH